MVMAAQNSTKKWIFIGGGLVIAAVLVVFYQNYPPKTADAAGTIGGAERYHAPQIAQSDVKVDQTELTTWLQSDVYDKIAKDPEARKLFANESVRVALANDSVRNAFSTD